MKINVMQTVADYEGKPLMRNKTRADGTPVLGDDGRVEQEPQILRDFLVLALNNTAEQEREVFTPEQKSKIYELTLKLYARKNVDFTLDDAGFIKERMGKMYGPLVLGRVVDMLEGRDRITETDGNEEQEAPGTPPRSRSEQRRMAAMAEE